MTGYLHIPTDELAEKLAQWFQVTLSYHNFKTWDDGQFGGEMVEFLRGLSVEPTEVGRSAERCRAYAAALMGVVPELDDPEAAELVTRRAVQWEAESERSVAAPVPVQEDQP